jgi:hypothetical protein
MTIQNNTKMKPDKKEKSTIHLLITNAATVILLLVFMGQAAGQPVQLKQILVPEGMDFAYYLGGEISIDGNYLIAGRNSINLLRKNKASRKAFIFEKHEEQWRIVDSIAGWGGVALSGDRVAVRDYSKVYPAHRKSDTNWVLEDTIKIPGEDSYKYGRRLDMNGDYLIISSSRDNEAAENAGAAYIYRRDSSEWVFEKKLMASDAEIEDRFGGSVSIHGNYALVGAYNERNCGLSDSYWGDGFGAAYLYRRDGGMWHEIQKFQPARVDSLDRFGFEVLLTRDHIFIGSPLEGWKENNPAPDSGKIYIYDRAIDSCRLDTILKGPDTKNETSYGVSLAYDDNHLLVGRREEYCKSIDLYSLDGGFWSHEAELKVAEEVSNGYGWVGSYFGLSVGISGNTAVVGAPWADTEEDDLSGAVSIYGPFIPVINEHPEDKSPLRETERVKYGIGGDSLVTLQWQRSPKEDSVFYSLSESEVFSGVTTDTLTVTIADTLDGDSYRCIASNQNGSDTSKTANLYLYYTGIEQDKHGLLNKVTLYPNPTRGRFILDASGLEGDGPVSVRVLSSDGRLVERKTLRHHLRVPVSLKNHPDGPYFLQLNQNGRTGTMKVIKQ